MSKQRKQTPAPNSLTIVAVAVLVLAAVIIIAILFNKRPWLKDTPDDISGLPTEFAPEEPDDAEDSATAIFLDDAGELMSAYCDIVETGDSITIQSLPNDLVPTPTKVTRPNTKICISKPNTETEQQQDAYQVTITLFDIDVLSRPAYKVEPDSSCKDSPGLIIYTQDSIYYAAEANTTVTELN